MAFNPNLPVDDSPLDAAEMRGQLNALKAINDAQAVQIAALTARVAALENGKPSMDDVNAAIVANSSANCSNVEVMTFDFSDPPIKQDLDGFLYGVNQLIMALHRPS